MNKNKLKTGRPYYGKWYDYGTKKDRKERRKNIKAIRHKLLMRIPLSDSEKELVVRQHITAFSGIDRNGFTRHAKESIRFENPVPEIFNIYKKRFLLGFYTHKYYDNWEYESGVLELTDNKIVTVDFRNDFINKGNGYIRITTCDDSSNLITEKIINRT